MSKHYRWIAVLLLILGFSALACDAFGGGPDPTSEPARQTTEDEPEAAPVQEGDSAGDEVDRESAVESDISSGQEELAEDLDLATIRSDLDLDSYRLTLLLSFGGVDSSGVEFIQNVEADVSFVADPVAMEMSMVLEGVEGAEEIGEISMAQIDDTSYMIVPGIGCISSSVVDDNLFDANPFASFLDPDEFLKDLDGARHIGTEVVNGVPTVVYAFDETFMDANAQMEKAEGQLYVAQDENYVVRMVMDGEGVLDLLGDESDQKGTIHLEFDITDINQPLEIGIPAECEEAAEANSDIPMLEDAFEVSSIGDMLSYRSNDTVQDAVEFYEPLLTGDGWTKNEDESFELGNAVMLTFQRDGEALSLSINEEEGGEGISVLIISESSEQ